MMAPVADHSGEQPSDSRQVQFLQTEDSLAAFVVHTTDTKRIYLGTYKRLIWGSILALCCLAPVAAFIRANGQHTAAGPSKSVKPESHSAFISAPQAGFMTAIPPKSATAMNAVVSDGVSKDESKKKLRATLGKNLDRRGVMKVGLATSLAYGQRATAADSAGFTKSSTGLQYKDLKEGTGIIPEPGNGVKVQYSGWLDDFGDDAGRKFDSSYDRGKPLAFNVGTGKVIKGWDEAILTMKVGGKRRVIIPPELGYGSKGIGPIPGGATLYFEMELVAITSTATINPPAAR